MTGDAIPVVELLPWIGTSATTRRFEDAGGRYALSGLPAGAIALTFRAPGYAAREIAARAYS